MTQPPHNKPKLGLPAQKRLPVAQAEPKPKPPSGLVPPNHQPHALTLHEIVAQEMVRADKNAAVALEAAMVRIVGDDELFRRIAVPMLRKGCEKHIKSVKRQIAFQEAVARAVAQQKKV
jgi:hypothetical protein